MFKGGKFPVPLMWSFIAYCHYFSIPLLLQFGKDQTGKESEAGNMFAVVLVPLVACHFIC